jgi:hypothetical protein
LKKIIVAQIIKAIKDTKVAQTNGFINEVDLS